ncbi:MAG: thioredoxin family protein [Clostridium sp.]|nr:thioredoxin family protein [Clostridium sp.]
MKKLLNENDIINLINDNKMAVVYFTGMDCGACEAIKYKVESVLENFSEIKSGEINGEENLVLAAKYEVFSLPIFLLFIEGKETLRIGRNVDLLELERNIKRYYEMIF